MTKDNGEEEVDPRVGEGTAQLAEALRAARRRHASAEAEARRYRMFLDNVLDYAFVTLDLSLQIIGWSAGAERILGYAEAEALTLSSAAFFTPEDVARKVDVREMETAREHGSAQDERWHVRRDGSRFWASGVMTSLRAEDGALLGFIKVMRDHTARRLAEQALRHSEERLRLFTDNVHDYALVSVDPEGTIVGWNPGAARIFGYAEEEALGMTMASLGSPDDPEVDASASNLRRALAEGRAEDEGWMVRKDGGQLWSRGVTTPMYDAEGQLRGFAKVLHDETGRKQAELLRERLRAHESEALRHQVRSAGAALDRTKEELRALAGSLISAQEDERRRIARDLHDDLSQRMTALQLGLGRIRRSLSEAAAGTAEALMQLEAQIAALAQDVRRLSHRLHPAVLDDLGLAAALRRLSEEFSATRTAAVAFVEQGSLPTLPANVSGALYRVAQEALHNISKHAGLDPVRISIIGEPGAVSLVVEDAGPGFDPARVRGRGGLGIISMEERLHLVGGALRFHSQPGHGTRIVARVPVAP